MVMASTNCKLIFCDEVTLNYSSHIKGYLSEKKTSVSKVLDSLN